MDSLKCQTATVSPAKPGGFPFLAKLQQVVDVEIAAAGADRQVRIGRPHAGPGGRQRPQALLLIAVVHTISTPRATLIHQLEAPPKQRMKGVGHLKARLRTVR